MSELENQEPKQEEAQPVVAPLAPEQATAEQPAATQTREQENVLWNLGVLDPGDHRLLAQVLRDHPEMRDQIIAKASADLGNDTVAKALALLAGVQQPEAPSEQAAAPPPASAPAAPAQEQTFDYTTSPLALEYDQDAKVKDHVDFMQAHPVVADQVLAQTAELDVNLALQVAAELDGRGGEKEQAPPQREETPPQVIEETSRAAAEEVKPEARAAEPPVQAPAQEIVEARPVVPEPEKESGWVVRAREFNAEHADDVARFLAATGGACIVDGALDPNLVAQWQSRHGVSVDGRIGAQTVEQAIRQQPQTFEEAAKEAEQEHLPEPDPTDPRFAL